MTLFKKLIKRTKKIEPRRLDLSEYTENREKVDILAEKIFKDLSKANQKKESLVLNLKLKEKEFDSQEHNYCHFRVLSNSREFAERISKLIRFTRVDVLFFTSNESLSIKELDKLIVQLIEIKRLILHSTLKLFNVEKEKVVDWSGEFEICSSLDAQETQIMELINKLLRVNSMITDAVINNCNIEKEKVLLLLRVDGIKDKRIPRVL